MLKILYYCDNIVLRETRMEKMRLYKSCQKVLFIL